jgi:hypothetical protein
LNSTSTLPETVWGVLDVPTLCRPQILRSRPAGSEPGTNSTRSGSGPATDTDSMPRRRSFIVFDGRPVRSERFSPSFAPTSHPAPKAGREGGWFKSRARNRQNLPSGGWPHKSCPGRFFAQHWLQMALSGRRSAEQPRFRIPTLSAPDPSSQGMGRYLTNAIPRITSRRTVRSSDAPAAHRRTPKHWEFRVDLPANHFGPGWRRRAAGSGLLAGTTAPQSLPRLRPL